MMKNDVDKYGNKLNLKKELRFMISLDIKLEVKIKK